MINLHWLGINFVPAKQLCCKCF